MEGGCIFANKQRKYMKEFFKMFFASMLAMIVMGIIGVGLLIATVVGISRSVTEKDNKKVNGNVLVLDLTKRIHEQGESNSFAMFGSGDDYVPGLYDIVKSIGQAKRDGSIKGILVKLGHTPNGWATMQQLRLA